MSTPATRGQSHLPQLDALRGLAILGVFLFHYGVAVFTRDRLAWAGVWPDLSSSPSKLYLALYPLTWGWMGVALFFVLSGFVIHHSYLRAERFDVLEFYWRRFWRLYPAYLVVMLALALVRLDMRQPGAAFDLLAHIFLIYNFFPSTFYGINASFWSLAVELDYYLLFPLLLLVRARFGMRGVILLTAAVSAASRLAVDVQMGWSGEYVYPVWYAPLTLWLTWVLGAYVAERYAAGRRAFRLPRVAVAALAALLAGVTLFRPLAGEAFTLAALLSAILIDWLLAARPQPGRLGRALAPLGLASYSVYLCHSPLIYALRGAMPLLGLRPSYWLDWSAALVAVAAAIYGISWLLYRAVEQPGLRLGRRLWGPGRGAAGRRQAA